MVNNLGFPEALTMCLGGNKIAREGWNGKHMYVRMLSPYAPHPSTVGGACTLAGMCNPYFKAADNNPQADGTMSMWLGLKTADNMFVPWQPSQTDMFAKDWAVLGD